MTDNNNDKDDDNEPGAGSTGLGFDPDLGFRLGDIEVLPRQGVVVRDGERIRLQPKPMQVLVCLATRDGETVLRNAIEEEVWPGEVHGPEVLDTAIHSVRQGLGDTDAQERQFVKNIPRVGYRLITDVTPLVDPASSASSAWRGWAIASAVVMTVAVVAYVWWPRGDDLPLTTISVQCFDNLSDAPESEYFAEGLADEIRAALSRVDGVRVVSRTSSQSLCESGFPISEIGEQLDAGSILDGSVRRDGDQVRIGVQLGNANNDRVVLSENYSGALADIFDLQNRIATDIAHQMRVTLAPGEQLVVAPTQDLDAYQLYLRAHFQLRRRGVEPVQRAIRLFQEAIARDPGYGRAYQGLAEAFAIAPSYTGAAVDPFIEMSLAALDQAEVLGGTDSRADAVRAFIHMHNLEWEPARAGFQAALAGEPGNSDLLQWHSQFLADLGYVDRALAVTRKSVEEDPLSPVAHQRLGIVLIWHDDLEGAEEQFRIATEELGLSPAANARTVFPLLLRQGRYAEAKSLAEATFTMGGEPIDWLDPWIAYLQGDGPATAAVTALNEAYEIGLDSRLYVGALYFVDDANAQFEAIERVLDVGRPLDQEVWFVEEGRVLQGDPRFPALLESLSIIDYWDAHGWPSGCQRAGDLIQCGQPAEGAAQASAGDPPES